MIHRQKLIASSVACCIFPLINSAMAAPSLEEVVVTAQKREQSMQDVGISVTAMSGENQRGGRSSIPRVWWLEVSRAGNPSPARTRGGCVSG